MSSMGASYALLHVQQKRLQDKLQKQRVEKDGAKGASVGHNNKSDSKNKIHPSGFSDTTK
ncbi:hypothetical protein DCAR_0312994 [Daucus carota subsp. sativus]|uniref:Uncharacterized protein n=1 Tax=Daucus carota subsp. sativus TaxID=79200 RepID=A0A166F173_DAUCS|nr:hypothetical protein DCAR_0312994 [Daucus carota subsp. sativus]